MPWICLHTVGSVDSLCKHRKILQADLVHFSTAGNLKYKFCKKTHISRPRTLYNRFSSRVARLHDLRGTDTFSLTLTYETSTCAWLSSGRLHLNESAVRKCYWIIIHNWSWYKCDSLSAVLMWHPSCLVDGLRDARLYISTWELVIFPAADSARSALFVWNLPLETERNRRPHKIFMGIDYANMTIAHLLTNRLRGANYDICVQWR